MYKKLSALLNLWKNPKTLGNKTRFFNRNGSCNLLGLWINCEIWKRTNVSYFHHNLKCQVYNPLNHLNSLFHLMGGKNCPPSATVTSSVLSSSISLTLFAVPGFSFTTPEEILLVSGALGSAPVSGCCLVTLLLLSCGAVWVASAPIGCSLSRVRALRFVQPPSACTLLGSTIIVVLPLDIVSEEMCASVEAWCRDVRRDVPRCLWRP